MPETSEHAVIAYFDSATQAEQAVEALKRWDEANEDIKLGAIGVLTKGAAGKVETKNFSVRNTGKGAKVGIGLGALAAVLSGGLTLLPTAIAGAGGGALVGSLSKKGLGLSDDDLQQLGAQLEGGRAALLVLCDDPEVEATAAQLAASGGTVRRPAAAVSAEALQEAAQASGAAAESSGAGAEAPARPASPDAPAEPAPPATDAAEAPDAAPPPAAPAGAGAAEGRAHLEGHGAAGPLEGLTGVVRRHPGPVLGGLLATVALLVLLVLLGRRRVA